MDVLAKPKLPVISRRLINAPLGEMADEVGQRGCFLALKIERITGFRSKSTFAPNPIRNVIYLNPYNNYRAAPDSWIFGFGQTFTKVCGVSGAEPLFYRSIPGCPGCSIIDAPRGTFRTDSTAGSGVPSRLTMAYHLK